MRLPSPLPSTEHRVTFGPDAEAEAVPDARKAEVGRFHHQLARVVAVLNLKQPWSRGRKR